MMRKLCTSYYVNCLVGGGLRSKFSSVACSRCVSGKDGGTQS